MRACRFIVFLLAILLLANFISADASTSVYSIQSSADFGNYQALFNNAASTGVKQSEQFFDMEVFIPPAGCIPNVVRSDLLEEQNVPVFCELTALKINPGIDITNIDRITFARNSKNQSPYISGIGFYPANAAIRSQTSLISTPLNGILGYVVVVLKQQPNEKIMPDFVTENLSAVLNYGAEYKLGIGPSEYYIPALTESEFADVYRSYGILGGRGYLRVSDVTSDSALVQIYTSPDRRVSSQSLRLGKTVDNILIPTSTGGQYLKMTLEDITLPKTKAKLNVNGEEYEVYKDEKFYNDKCTVTKIISTGAGTGEVSIKCLTSDTKTLSRKFNDVQLIIDSSSESQSYKIGELFKSDKDNNYYLLYFGNINSKDFIIAGKIPKTLADKKDSIEGIKKNLDQVMTPLMKKNDSERVQKAVASKNLKYYNEAYSLVYITKDSPAEGITLKQSLSANMPLTGDNETYFNKAMAAYEDVASKFGSITMPGSSRTYGEQALWDAYKLANDNDFQQKARAREILSKIEKQYPDSLSDDGRKASELFSSQDPYSAEGSSYYFDEQGIKAQLVSIEEPSREDASAEITFSNSAGTDTQLFEENETIYENKIGNKKMKLVLQSFNEKSAAVKCYYTKISTQSGKTTSSDEQKTVNIENQKTEMIEECDASVTIGKINLKKVAKIRVVPESKGISNSANFTFSIGIEKRNIAMNLTPAEANKKMEDLSKQIAKLQNITEMLNSTIRAGKLACLATSAYINLKNLLSSEGTATARTMAMKNAWNSICAKKPDFEKCISENSGAIESSIGAVRSALEKSNGEEKGFQDAAKEKNSKVVDYAKSLNYSVIAFKKDFKDNKENAFGKIEIYDNKDQQINLLAGKIEDKNIADIIAEMDSTRGHIGQKEFTDLKADVYTLQNLGKDEKLDEFRKIISQRVYNALAKVKSAEDTMGVASDLSDKAGATFEIYGDKQTKDADYIPLKWPQIQNHYNLPNGITIGSDEYVKPFGSVITHSNYLAVLQKSSNIYTIKKLYLLGDTSGDKIEVQSDVTDDSAHAAAKKFIFHGISSEGLKNRCTNCNFMQVFETAPYKGQPAMLPFDSTEGWYVYAENNIPTGGTLKTYQDSGTPATFYICNVGPNGLMEGKNSGDDSQFCTIFSTLTGQTASGIVGLDSSKSTALIQKALSAIKSSQSQIAAGKNPISINGMTLKVQGIAGNNDGSKCTDFMSDSDCKLMFNVCDPFICPTSRCDLGGEYPVDNVIQSGVVGSVALCMPNFVGFGGDVYIPVCLTGINAGLEGWISILKSYKNCINESVINNKTVGICDQINSVYVCDFFWRNVGPYVSILSKNILSGSVFGNKGVRGGGEYLFANDAWNNAEKSWNYFINSYASTSNLGAGFSSVAQVGTEICKMQMSATYPNKLDAALNPESPVQFYSYFEELPFNSAVVPPSSQYNIFYHIFAGNEQGHYYTVYLRQPNQAITYTIAETAVIDSGYISKGQEVSQTVNRLLTSGYKELCVRIDNQDHCGFKSVGTDFGLNYAKDKLVSAQAGEGDIKTQDDCISGTTSISAAGLGGLGGNIQQSAQSVVNPQIYNYGVIRICSGQNPGASTEPLRWKEVGYCDNANIKCWIDTTSVKDAIRGAGIQNETLGTISAAEINQKISEGYLKSEDADAKIKEFETLRANIFTLQSGEQFKAAVDLFSGVANLDSKTTELYKKLIYDTDKARLLYRKAQIYDVVARTYAKKAQALAPVNGAGKTAEKTDTIPVTVEKGYYLKTADRDYLWVYKDGARTNLLISEDKKFVLYDLPVGISLSKIAGIILSYNTYFPSFFTIENNILTLNSIMYSRYSNNIDKTKDVPIINDLKGARIDFTTNKITTASEIKAAAITINAPPSIGLIHKVEEGDTFLIIAKNYAVDEVRIREVNKMATGEPAEGTSIIIPISDDAGKEFFKKLISEEGETLSEISEDNGIILSDLRKFNTHLKNYPENIVLPIGTPIIVPYLEAIDSLAVY